MSLEKEKWLPDFLEYCEIMNLIPTIRDQTIFMAGMTLQSIKNKYSETDQSNKNQDKAG